MESVALVASIVAAVLSLFAALGAWRTPAATPASDERVQELIAGLKGGLLAELGRVRTSVESGIRDAADATRATQQELHDQTAMISQHLHEELQNQFAVLCQRVEMLVEARFGQMVAGVDKRFKEALEDQRTALAEQLDNLRDLRRSYENHLASLRKDVAATGSNNLHAIHGLNQRIEQEFDLLQSRIDALTGTVGPRPVELAGH